MTKRLAKVSLCALVAIIAGMVSCATVEAANSPGSWSHLEWLWNTALAGGLFYSVVPVSVLVLVAVLRPAPSAVGAILVPIVWLAVIFAWWARRPWLYYGEFPWSGFQRHFLGMLPVPLSIGFAFALCARSLSSSGTRSRTTSSMSHGERQ